MKNIKFKANGIVPLLMHSDRFSNPLDKLTKEHKQITSKRKKTDEDHEAIALSEWRGSLYADDKEVIYMPAENVEACIVAAAKLQRLGTHFKRGVLVLEEKCEFDFKGKNTIKYMMNNIENYSLSKSVVVNRARIVRVRPMFHDWTVNFTVAFNEDIVSESDVLKAVEDAGSMIGLCDWRPRYGRFTVEVV